MFPQYVAKPVVRLAQVAALTSQIAALRVVAYACARASCMIGSGGDCVARTSQRGQVGAKALYWLFHSNRRITCRTVSKPFWRWVWLLLWQPAHSKKKNTLWSSPSRSRLSPSTPANTSNVGYRLLTQEQAAGRPVPVNPRALIKGSKSC